ncbi:hypothetical protein CRYUN_Cryun40dG0029900 [Craigia yunnanensis]
MRGRSDGGQKKRLIISVCVVAIFLGLLFVYYGSIFGSSSHGAAALEYGNRSLRKLGSSYSGGDDEADGKQYESSIKFGQEEGEDVIPKTFPVCDDRHSELIPCLDRNFIYQMRLKDGILLLELDRLLRPGGYFAYSSPEAYAQDEEDLRIWREMSALVRRMCWRIAAKRNQTVIWQKPLTNDCYTEREPGTNPPLCLSDDDPDAVWGVPMKACITPYSDHDQKTKGSGLAPWPARLTSPPPRLADFGYSSEMFEKDTETWHRRVESYWNLLSPKIEADTLRNLMDMKANMGSFAAALKGKNVWVMNVVSEDGPNALKLIYDRGLIGTTHNWCEAFSTYPRTYDLLHAWTVFSDIEKKGCSAEDLLLEMDRILRPSGFIIIRDKQPVIDFIRKYLSALHWEAVATADSSSDSDHEGDDFVFIVQKKLWLTNESLRNSE